MPTKGPSNHYCNSKGGRPSKYHKDIGFKFAVDFNKYTLNQHFIDHGKQMNCNTVDEYRAHAIKFANCVDNINFTSFIDNRGTTYKYDKKNNILALIDKKGYVLTYYKPTNGYKYHLNEKKNKSKE